MRSAIILLSLLSLTAGADTAEPIAPIEAPALPSIEAIAEPLPAGPALPLEPALPQVAVDGVALPDLAVDPLSPAGVVLPATLPEATVTETVPEPSDEGFGSYYRAARKVDTAELIAPGARPGWDPSPPRPPRAAGPLAWAGLVEPEEPDPIVSLASYVPEPSTAESHVIATMALGVTALLAVLGRLYSRFEKRDVLQAAPRARIHAALVERPGATLAELTQATGLRRGALIHHCQMLERHGVIASLHDGLNRRFYPAGPRFEPPPRPTTSAERRVLDLLRAQGPLTQAEMAALLGVTPQAVSYHVVRMRDRGRLEADESSGERRWAVSPACERVERPQGAA